MSALAIAAAFVAATAGFAALAMAMTRHAREIFGRAPGQGTAWTLRIAGAVLLAAAHAFSATAWGAAIGAVAWFGVVTAGALAVVLALALRPARRR